MFSWIKMHQFVRFSDNQSVDSKTARPANRNFFNFSSLSTSNQDSWHGRQLRSLSCIRCLFMALPNPFERKKEKHQFSVKYRLFKQALRTITERRRLGMNSISSITSKAAFTAHWPSLRQRAWLSCMAKMFRKGIRICCQTRVYLAWNILITGGRKTFLITYRRTKP